MEMPARQGHGTQAKTSAQHHAEQGHPQPGCRDEEIARTTNQARAFAVRADHEPRRVDEGDHWPTLGIGQPQKESRRFSLRIGPAIQPSPDAHQTLVADVDHRIVPQGLPGRWHQEGPIAAAEVVDQLIDR